MADVEDVARLRYVLENYDSIEFEGKTSKNYRTKDGNRAPKVIFSKKIDGTYYVIEAVSDASKKRNYIVSAYIKKRTDV